MKGDEEGSRSVMRSEPNIEIITITDLSRGGAGVARDSGGRVIFVPLTTRGDQVRVRVISEKKRYAQAELLELLKPSPERITPRCKFFGRCGGCQWQQVPYEMQFAVKSEGSLAALKRVGIEPMAKIEKFPAETIWNYRNRVQLRGEGGALGFYARRSHDLVAIDRCEIADERINARLAALAAEGAKHSGPYKVEVEITPSGEVREHWNRGHAAGGFRQVHEEQNRKLQTWVASRLTQGRELLDLYGGAGNLSLSLAPQMKKIRCVDTSVPKGLETPANFSFERASVLAWLRRESKSPTPGPRSAILDPPREGLGETHEATAMILALEKLGVDEVIAVGCDPDSWARDLSRFSRHGWQILNVAVFDFFPQTPHVESVALLKKHLPS